MLNTETNNATLIAKMREAVEAELPYIERGDQPHSGLRYVTPFATMEAAFIAATHEYDRMKAERDQALAENTRLREACKDAPELLMKAWNFYLGSKSSLTVSFGFAKSLRETAEGIRAVLGSES